ncbi:MULTISPECIES: hypothetical protein [unclassified Agarivorans]|uniref:hypothetical protein n=1 Tax=unclassified Agarivorans TaxID=2636026 RepID=UPI0026E1F0EF|nr:MULTISPECIES: hypothetical protein [unclassified Agarivorans]MDO6687285.1 hypothetical protein [Agarivorans sp. 3_MG-2023]MDO6716943.1 hypothetical protein [Agarivorans sp. 2_MG-2023]
MKKTLTALALSSTLLSTASFATESEEMFLPSIIEDSIGSASSQVIAGIADKSVRDNLREYMDGSPDTRPKQHAIAAEYVKGIADGTINASDIETASGFYAKFKNGQAQDLHSSLVADG